MSEPNDPKKRSPMLDAHFTVVVGGKQDRFRVEAEVALDKGVLVLFGPSGAGKSLTLQALAGILRPQEGHIRLRGQTVFDAATRTFVPAHFRGVGYVPQHQSLFPFCNVAENVAFGLPHAARRGDHPRVQELLSELGILHLAQASPASLSGGERKRVALARSLAVRPSLLLLDEPFGSIDRDGRGELQSVLQRTLARHAIPAVIVTHEPDEALLLGSRLVRFVRGRSVESGRPADLLANEQPVSVAGVAVDSARLADGRAQLTLKDVVCTGPAALLDRKAGEAISLRLKHGETPDR